MFDINLFFSLWQTQLILIGIVGIFVLQNRFVSAWLSKFYYKLFGYGSCMQCGKKRQSMWLLVCNNCYELKDKRMGS